MMVLFESEKEIEFMIQEQRNGLIEIIVDFFNLVLGAGEETDYFWNTILKN